MDQSNKDNAVQPFTVTLSRANFRWCALPPWWAAVFIASGDRIPHGDELFSQIDMWEPEERELISVIGGMEFLKILGRQRFARVHLFDRNINELVKFALVYDYLLATPYEQFDGFRGLAAQIKAAPEAFYLPAATNRRLSLVFEESAMPSGREISAAVLQCPDEAPALAWRPTSAEYAQAVEQLRTVLNPELFLGIPRLELRDHVAVAYLSNCEITPGVLLERVHASMVYPIYAAVADNENNRPTNNRNTEANKKLLDPHPLWEEVVKRYAPGRRVQVWGASLPPKSTSLAEWNVGLGQLLAHTTPADAIFFHIVLGENFGRSGEPAADRQRKLLAAIAKAKTLASRIVVSEHNKRSGQFDGYRWLPEPEEITAMVRGALAPEFQITAVRYSGGKGRPDRNLFIIADKGSIAADEGPIMRQHESY